ncbi:NECT2-like protein [Mya arenaria]|uniref:NECT2-like protein n=1 Tax=Mya arenaria TaxID=6604 RepID=A0ABY7E9V1_MYAAR|nr:NECT2-like protein [Mya arenaria]
MYICQSSYSGEPHLFRITEVKLFLKLQPITPLVTVSETVVESSSSIQIAQCISSGFRPKTVILSWSLGGETATSVSKPTVVENTTSNTFSVSETYTQVVDRADNRKTLTCSINHETLSSPRTASVTLNVQFPPSTATLTGYFTAVADGSIKPDVTVFAHNATEKLSTTLRCGPLGVPDSYTYVSWDHTWPGSSDVLRSFPGSPVLLLSDLRYEHSGIYTCRVDNGPSSQPAVVSITYVQETTALLTWTRGFHGGSNQTVKIETSRDRTSWTTTLSLPQGTLEDTLPVNTTITELAPGTLYYLRMFSVNEDGTSSKTGLLNFTTKG